MYRTTPRFPLVYLFFFGVQNRFFFCSAKEKAVLAPAGQAKTNCKIKTSRFPTKEKAVLPSRATPIRKAVKPPTTGLWPSAGPAATNKVEKEPLFAEEKDKFMRSFRRTDNTRKGHAPRSSQNACPFSALKERLGVPTLLPSKRNARPLKGGRASGRFRFQVLNKRESVSYMTS